jgi:hypothetical protein
MATKQQTNGMLGVFLAAAELARRGWIVSLTSRGAAGADILMTTDDCNKSYSVQIKTRTTGGSWFVLGNKAKTTKSDTHIYVLLDIKRNKKLETITYYIVPSRDISKLSEPANPNFSENNFVIAVSKLTKYKDGWSQFGDPAAKPRAKRKG